MLTKKHFINLISLSACAFITLYFLMKVSAEFNLSYLWAAGYNVFWLSIVVLLNFSSNEKVKNFIPVFIAASVLLVHFILIISGYSREILWLTLNQNSLFSAIVFLTVIYLSDKTSHIKNYYILINAVLFGLMLYFNIDLLLPLIIFTFYFYRQNLLLLLLFILSVFLVIIYSPQLYGLVFSDYLFYSIEIFSLDFWTIIFAVTAIYAGWIISDSQELFFTCGLFLFFPQLLGNIFDGNNIGMDSYVISIPFFLMAIRNYKVDKFFGKVFSAGMN